jgi:hypothetical protein
MSNSDPHHHSKTSHTVLDKLTNKISALKEDITEAVKERSRSFSADRFNSMPSINNLSNANTVAFSLPNDTPSIAVQPGKSFKTSGKY